MLTRSSTQWFLYFGLGNALQKLFGNPEFVAARAQSRDTTDPSTFYGSPVAAAMNQATGGALFQHTTSAYSLGFDFVKLFNLRDHSSGVVALRCEDLSPVLRGKKEFTRVLMIIPGPKEPSNVDIYMELMTREFAAYGPDGQGLVVTPLVRCGDGKVKQGVAFKHTVMLVGLHADSPARSKAGHFLGAAAYFGCPWCWITGTRVGDTMTYLGYKEPTVIKRGVLRGMAVQIGVNDEHRVLSEVCQWERSAAYLEEEIAAKASNQPAPQGLSSFFGISGFSVFHEKLAYLDMQFNSFWMVPFCHAVFLGLVKDLVRVMTNFKSNHQPPALMIAKKQLKLVSGRETDFVLTTDFNRPYSCFVAHSGRYVIEDWARLLLVYSSYLFCPDVHDGQHIIGGPLKKAWGHLRRFVQYHYAPKNFDSARREEARNELIEYAKILEEHCPSLCKQNLHILCCRLNMQEEARGSVYGELELWIERVVQDVKRKTRYRATTDPEKVAARSITANTAMELMKVQYPSLRNIDDEIKKRKRARGDAAGYDEPDDVGLIGEGDGDDTEMVGAGKRPSAGEWDLLHVKLREYLENVQADSWEATDLDGYNPLQPEECRVEVWVHNIARLGNNEYVASEDNGRARSRESFFVKVPFRGLRNNVVREFIARVRKLVRIVKRREGGEAATLRFALCDVYKYQEPFDDEDLGKLYKATEYKDLDTLRARAKTYVNQFLPVLLETIDTKVYRATVQGERFDRHFFGTYAFSSGIR